MTKKDDTNTEIHTAMPKAIVGTEHIIEVDEDEAIIQVNEWLDKKRVLRSKRSVPLLKELYEATAGGLLIPNPNDGTIVQKLIWPIEGKDSSGNVTDTLKVLTYKARIRHSELDLKGVSPSDQTGMFIAAAAAATKNPKALISKLDLMDIGYCQLAARFLF